jgi:hypothetical protein
MHLLGAALGQSPVCRSSKSLLPPKARHTMAQQRWRRTHHPARTAATPDATPVRSDRRSNSAVPDYLVYQVMPDKPKAEWKLIGRGRWIDTYTVHVLFTCAPKGAVVLRPMWPHLHRGKQEWNRPPDYVVLKPDQADPTSRASSIGGAWTQTGGKIYVKLPKCRLDEVILRRLGARNSASVRPLPRRS